MARSSIAATTRRSNKSSPSSPTVPSNKLILADPPYGLPQRCTATATTEHACDNDTQDAAKQAILDLLRLGQPKLAAGGCLVLFQPGSALDPPWLTTAIADLGWSCHATLTWAKGKTKLGNANTPYGISSERILILSRAGDTLVNHDGSPRHDVLTHQPIQPRCFRNDHHRYEKPEELMRFLIGKHSYKGDVIVEPFGGAGSGSRAACLMERRWVYCESNAKNFHAAVSRLVSTSQTDAVAA